MFTISAFNLIIEQFFTEAMPVIFLLIVLRIVFSVIVYLMSSLFFKFK